MKRILFIIESPSFGGAELVLKDIANSLDVTLFDVTICSLFKKSVFGKSYPYEIKQVFRNSIQYRYIFNNGIPGVSLLANFCLYRFPSFIYRLFIRDKYDTVVAFYEGAPTRFLSKAPIKRGKKIAWLHTSTILSQSGKNTILLDKEESVYRSFYRIIAVSRDSANSFLALFPDFSFKTFVAYNPIDLQTIRERARERIEQKRPSVPLLVSVGRITWAKGYDRYLRVLKNLLKKGFSFQVWIIGGGERSFLERIIDKDLIENIVFWNHQDNPFPLIRMADWIVVPSYVEGFSMVVLESLALGKAILATDCGGPKEILGDGAYGLLVQNNEVALEKGLERALTDLDLKRKFELLATSRSSDFDISSCLPRIEKLLT